MILVDRIISFLVLLLFFNSQSYLLVKVLFRLILCCCVTVLSIVLTTVTYCVRPLVRAGTGSVTVYSVSAV